MGSTASSVRVTINAPKQAKYLLYILMGVPKKVWLRKLLALKRSTQTKMGCLSRIQPPLKVLVQPLKHLGVVLLGISEKAPTKDILVLAGAFKLGNELVDQRKLILVRVAEMLFAQVCGLLLAVFGSKAHDASSGRLGKKSIDATCWWKLSPKHEP